mgnify:CR=1 FL=1
MSLLDIEGLGVAFEDEDGHPLPAVQNVSFSLEKGAVTCLVGESGCGKSLTARAILGILPRGATAAGSVRFEDRELIGLPEKTMSRLRGRSMAMIFQEPMTALNPVFTVGDQIAETLMLHEGLERRAAWGRAEGLLAEVGIPEPAIRVRNYPFELSGGMRQRAAFARTMLTGSELLLLDEPFSALDFLTRISMQEWLLEQWQKHKKTILFITHDVEEALFLSSSVLVVERTPIHTLTEIPVPAGYPRTRECLARSEMVALREDLIGVLRKQVQP